MEESSLCIGRVKSSLKPRNIDSIFLFPFTIFVVCVCVFVGNLIQLRLVAAEAGQKGETSGASNILTSDSVATVGKHSTGCCYENYLNQQSVCGNIKNINKLIKNPFVEIKRIFSLHLAGHRIIYRLKYKKAVAIYTATVYKREIFLLYTQRLGWLCTAAVK